MITVFPPLTFVMLCAIWYHLYNLKNVTVIFLLKLTLLHGCFSCFLDCTNDTKSRKASQILQCHFND